MIEHLFLDFDGTLVDSADGILRTLRICIERAGVPAAGPISRALIGPPLDSMIAAAIGPGHPASADIKRDFIREYDATGHRETVPYAGIEEALRALHAGGITLNLVSNKRLVPLRRIVDMLGWDRLFDSINTLDSGAPSASKTAVAAQLLARIGTAPRKVILVGDSLDDKRAAAGNGIRFGWAAWGYGPEALRFDCDLLLEDPQALAAGVLAGAAA